MDFGETSDTELWDLLDSSSGEEKGKILIELSFRNLRRGEFNKAISCAHPAIELFQELKIRDQESIANYVLGCASRAEGDIEQAIGVLNAACEGFREIGLENLLGLACYELANAHALSGNISEADGTFVSSLNILTSAGDAFGVTQTGCDYGEFLGSLGQQSRALDVFTKTKEFAKKLEDPLKVAFIDDRIAACLIELARGTEALDHLKAALDVISYTGTKGQLAWALYRYGWTLQTFGYFHQALNILEQAKEVFGELDEIREKAKCDFQIAHVLCSLGEYEDANALYAKLKEVFSSIGDEESSILCEVNRASNISKAGDKETASRIFRDLIEDLDESEFGYIRRFSRIELAHCLNSMEFYAEALEQVEMIDIEEYGDNRLARLGYLNTKARTLVYNNRSEEGERLLQEIFNTYLCKGLEATYAEALETLSIINHIRGNDLEMLDLRGKAISYFLAGGDVSSARRLADTFAFAPSDSISQVQELAQTDSGFKFGFSP